MVYHGTPYSPKNEQWPGWMFYASVHFAPTNTWWEDLKAINSYVTNCQSFMQNSKPTNDICSTTQSMIHGRNKARVCCNTLEQPMINSQKN
ncbi:MAG: hypothetical protein H6613_02925 [Ignavibacteriales bacterium]|nr:hypothetical protein [Ignavibacteriales bacterium]